MKNFQIEGLVELSCKEAQNMQGGGFWNSVVEGISDVAHAIGYACGVLFGATADAVEIAAKNLPTPTPTPHK